MSKEITNIVFYKNTSKERKEKPRACIFYSDKTYNNVNFHEGKEKVNEFFRSKEIYFNYFDYLNEKYIYYLEGETFEDNFNSFLNNNKEKIETLPKIRPKDPFWKKMGITITLIFLMVIIEIYSGLGKDKVEQPIITESTISYLEEDLSNPNIAYQRILSQISNQSIKSIFSKTKDFLYYYNTENANLIAEEQIKPVLTFDEVMMLNVILNDLSLSKIDMIYEGQTPSDQELKNIYLNAFNQIVLSHVVDTQKTFSLEKLIIDEKEQNEYKKYLKAFNDCREKQGSEPELNKFCKMVRENFLSNKNKEQPPLSVIPLINAFKILYTNLNIENFLTLDEINIINYNCLYKTVNEKIGYINKSMQITSEYPCVYEGLKYIVEYDLSLSDYYYNAEDKRDLTQLSTFNSYPISDTAYLEIMLENYKMFIDCEYKTNQELTQTTTENSNQNKVNTKKVDKSSNS